MIRPILAAAGTFAMLLGAQSAYAAKAEVRHNDLDLSTAQGQRELDKRIHRAARAVCTAPATTGSLVGRLDRDCYTAALASARQQVAQQVAVNDTAARR